MKALSDFSAAYAASKTLRFELRPIGATQTQIDKKGLLQQDASRAEDYQRLKKIIDEYHKHFMEQALSGLKLHKLEEYQAFYLQKSKDEKELKAFESLKTALRKQVVAQFEACGLWKDLFAKELITKALAGWDNAHNDTALVAKFSAFTTYFAGFHENRKNIYSSDEKRTAAATRIVHENLPKFLDNLKIFASLQERFAENTRSNIQTDIPAIEQALAELLQGKTLPEIFSLEFFNQVLTQSGIDFYNQILGGYTSAAKGKQPKRKVQGLNEYINLYNQAQSDKSKRIARIKPLYKQILSDRSSISFLPEAFADKKQCADAINDYYLANLLHHQTEEMPQSENLLAGLQKLLSSLREYEPSQLYLRNGKALTDISQSLFGDWSFIKSALAAAFEQRLTVGKKGITLKQIAEKEAYLKQAYFSIQEINTALAAYAPQINSQTAIADYFKNCRKDESGKDLLYRIDEKYNAVKGIFNVEEPSSPRTRKFSETETLNIKTFLDSLLDLLHFAKALILPKDSALSKDEVFYGQLERYFSQLELVAPLYDKVRNFCTQKAYSSEKIKLNFENSTLLAGWDKNKESDNSCVLLRKDGLYYLAIMDKQHRKVFEDKNRPTAPSDAPAYEKIVYKLLPGANKMLPKVFLSEKGKAVYKPSAELLAKYAAGTHKKNEPNFSPQDCRDLIDFFKRSIAAHEDWKQFGHQFSDTYQYEDISGFYREVEQQGYKISFQNIAQSYIDQLVEEGKIYLFQIYNKDFSNYSKGKPSLHTLYWKMLFDEKNLQNIVYKLDGDAEIFFRKKSLHYSEEKLRKGHHYEELKDKFSYPIISNRRFAFDKFMFHVPITMNFQAKGGYDNINFSVLEFLKNNPDVNIIGIDRGERHLLYLTLINQKGEILEQRSLNEVHKVNYHTLLDAKEKQRAEARESWGTIENIKELKSGYLANVIHIIAKMMVEHNAIVVLEDLNFGFMRGRQKVEKQVYQKFEKMLIDKLNYLVFKDRAADEAGGALRALQLASKFESFEKLGKQSGFLFYVPAALTSKIDPLTGFVDFLRPKYENVEKSQQFFQKFESIKFVNQRFEFCFSYAAFTTKTEGGQDEWTICSSDEPRFRWNKALNMGKGAQELIKVTEALQRLFALYKIDYSSGQELKAAIVAQVAADFFKELLRILATLLALRHNNGEKGDKEQDYILSPVSPFFNSAKAKATQPQDADANGAFHIALKGLWLLRQISSSEELKKTKLAMSNKDWLRFKQIELK